MSRAYHGINPDEEITAEAPAKELYVRTPRGLLVTAWTLCALDLVVSVLVWFWAEDWDAAALRKHQGSEYAFASGSTEVMVLSFVRVVMLALVLARSRAALVRVLRDGTVKASALNVAVLLLCGLCAAYSVFKVGFSAASASGTAGGWAVAAVAAVMAGAEGLQLYRIGRAIRGITARSFYEKLRAGEEDDLDGAELQEDESYTKKGLSLVQLMAVLKPYFWPKGDTPTAFMNRVRSTATWMFVIASKVCSVVSPFFLSDATNDLYDGDISGACLNVALYAILAFSAKALKECQNLVYLKVKQQAYIEIAEHAFAHLHSLSLQWHLKKKMGNVIRSMDRGTDAANNLVTYLFLYLVPAIGECIATVIVFYVKFKDWRLATMAFGALSVYGYATVTITLWRKKFRAATNKHDNDFHDKATDSIINYETVKYFTNEEYEVSRFCDSVKQFQRFSVSTQASLSVLNVLQQLIMYLTLVAGLVFAAQAVDDGRFSVGDFVSVNTYMVNLFTPLYFLGTVYNVIIQAFVDIRNLSELLSESPDIVDAPDARALPIPPKSVGMSIEFRDVWFWYPSQPSHRGLRGLSFFVEPGTTTALVGHTGAGKTTISRLLFRFYDPVKGQVLMNGHDVRLVKQQSVRRAIGVVPQDTVMFNDTILHNVQYGRMDATREEVEEAAEAAQIKRFIDQLPQGWDSAVGERGLKLSGGEKQRVAIARCLLKDPPIVLLDEATSALDTKTEQGVQEALNGLKTNRTTVVIAHRLSTIRNADQILVLSEGQVVERGNHKELMALRGEYHSMWTMQLQERERMKSLEKEIAADASAVAAAAAADGQAAPVAGNTSASVEETKDGPTACTESSDST